MFTLLNAVDMYEEIQINDDVTEHDSMQVNRRIPAVVCWSVLAAPLSVCECVTEWGDVRSKVSAK